MNTIESHTYLESGKTTDMAQYIIDNAGVEEEYKYLLDLSEKPSWHKTVFKNLP